MQAGDIRVGISGWNYAPWRGRFYPKGLKHKDELAFAAARYRAIEINGTFYSLQRPSSFQKWAAATPDDFVFAVKGPRFITHMLKLRNVEAPLANFLANGVLSLGPKLGPILWQLPPTFRFDREKLNCFLKLLPHDAKSAAVLARHHDHRVEGRTFLQANQKRRLRHAIEVRHNSFCDPQFVRLLRKYNVALVCADTVEWPLTFDVTADFMYCRLHGSKQLYTSGYGDKSLREWAALAVEWSEGGDPRGGSLRRGKHISHSPPPKRARRDVYMFFDNDAKVRAPRDAEKLAKLLSTRSCQS